jgi:hypothetical protein
MAGKKAECRLDKKIKEGKTKHQALNELAGAGRPGAVKGDSSGKGRKQRKRQGDK